MRISDWSSDVCSSDLEGITRQQQRLYGGTSPSFGSGAIIGAKMAALWRELHAVQQQLNMVAGVKQAHCIAQGLFRRFISAAHQHCLTDIAGQCGSRRRGKDRWGIEDHNPKRERAASGKR